MNPDPPKTRPLERFWPYADLPEQPTEEELAALDPDLHEALFGARPRPFSITLVFPTLDTPEFPRALEIARSLASGIIAVTRSEANQLITISGDERSVARNATPWYQTRYWGRS